MWLTQPNLYYFQNIFFCRKLMKFVRKRAPCTPSSVYPEYDGDFFATKIFYLVTVSSFLYSSFMDFFHNLKKNCLAPKGSWCLNFISRITLTYNGIGADHICLVEGWFSCFKILTFGNLSWPTQVIFSHYILEAKLILIPLKNR